MLGVANDFSQIWFQDHFLSLVRAMVNWDSQPPLKVKFVVDPHTLQPAPHRPEHRRPTPAGWPAVDLNLNPRHTFATFIVGPDNNFAHAATLTVAQLPAKARDSVQCREC